MLNISFALSLDSIGCSTFPVHIYILTPSKKDSVPSDKAISCANKAIKTAEKYLSYELDYKTAKEIIDDLQSDMEYVSNLSTEDPNYFPDSNIHTAIMGLSIDLIDDNFKGSDETYSKIQDDIEELKKLID